ncbi:hypothetical protein, conserved [Trypanosoma brucei gambiense DAL972]|uniref:Pentacotripeptide-repeat region of PRORP domain-containing protein n=1 Tax=Trypanosoma brucei gambiense (strain MHOM/CI/86/DAL972) TaxID=679716 RepID=C9ZW48_TRYB9|nr:hypothetical protein, conserved [Trypanosoma brucei gambiense DAL972]CBH13637.1 hypothetical protein, conserved [Trypanosoma brucei gambiense DAL972]|eukprot:XP_011775913.1 hypothetical protein, conserved [Trypanosoma brucei gambiense DAL972]
MLSSALGMGHYTRIISVYERFAVLSTCTIKREVERMLHSTCAGTSQQQQHQHQQCQLLTTVCDLLVKSGEWRRAFAVAQHLPLAERQAIVSAAERRQEGDAVQGQTTLGTSVLSNSDTSAPGNLHKALNEDLVRMAFALQRSGKKAALTSGRVETEESVGVDGEMLNTQQRIFRELSRRHRYRELIQCVINWKSRGLIPVKHKSVADVRCVSSDGSIDEHHKVSGDGNGSTMGAGSSRETSINRDIVFNAEQALQSLIFNSTSGKQWEEAMQHHQAFFIHMLRDPMAAQQLLRKTDVGFFSQLLLSLLRDSNTTTTTLSSPSQACGFREQATPWDTIASMCFALRSHVGQQKKVLKVELLHALLSALRREAKTVTVTRENAGFNSRSNVVSAAATSMMRSLPDDIGDRAMRSSVEGLCVPLVHHNEAQARFIGLPLFVDLALAMCDCGVPVTNALVQCMLLCLGNMQRHQLSETVPVPQTKALKRERELIMSLVTEPRAVRWLPALRLLQTCSEQHHFLVTSAHLRCLLGGLQSISIRQTWPAALSAASFLMTRHHIFPDEASVEKLMLNLHAASWQRVFEVLRLYDRKHIQPSPTILRDLHVVAMKHSSWDTVLRVMQSIKDVGHQQAGFMNYVYCLRAYGCAGKWNSAVKLFMQLKDVPRIGLPRPALNEKTVAVPVIAMMENNHWEEVIHFANTVWKKCGAGLTVEGAEVTRAATLLSLVHIGESQRVATFLNNCCGQRNARGTNASASADGNLIPDTGSSEVLRGIVVRAAQLQTLLGMEHLNSPIRLVFDLLGADKDGDKAEQFSVDTRSRSPRPQLYLPPQHIQHQHEWFATTLGHMTRHDERLFCAAAQQAVAEAMSSIGVAPVYLKAALL